MENERNFENEQNQFFLNNIKNEQSGSLSDDERTK